MIILVSTKRATFYSNCDVVVAHVTQDLNVPMPLVTSVYNKCSLMIILMHFSMPPSQYVRLFAKRVAKPINSIVLCVLNMNKTITMLAVMSAALAAAAGAVPAFAQSASSTGAATDNGAASSSAAGNFLTGGSSSSSAAGQFAFCASEGSTPQSLCLGIA
jgi:hypothetical protein